MRDVGIIIFSVVVGISTIVMTVNYACDKDAERKVKIIKQLSDAGVAPDDLSKEYKLLRSHY